MDLEVQKGVELLPKNERYAVVRAEGWWFKWRWAGSAGDAWDTAEAADVWRRRAAVIYPASNYEILCVDISAPGGYVKAHFLIILIACDLFRL